MIYNGFKLFDQNLALTGGAPAHSTEMLALNIYNTFYSRAGIAWPVSYTHLDVYKRQPRGVDAVVNDQVVVVDRHVEQVVQAKGLECSF